MAKQFERRIARKKRRTTDLSYGLDKSPFQLSDEKLAKGAQHSEIRIEDIHVKEQVRTKFNDASLKELAENIRVNGLIQPLVVHFQDGKYTLICGERRYRAMTLIGWNKCPCFILQNKTEKELMAIQFAENSVRESLHYVDHADGILNYQVATDASERKITADLGISKSEVHRSLIIAKVSREVKEAAKAFNIEKYVLLEFSALEDGLAKDGIAESIVAGKIRKRSELKKLLSGNAALPKKNSRKKPSAPRGMSANLFIKAMSAKTKEMDLDDLTRQKIDAILRETQEIVDV